MTLPLKTVLACLLICFSCNLIAAETNAERVAREQRDAIERNKNNRTIHGKLESSLPSARQKARAFIDEWEQKAEYARSVKQNREETERRLRENRRRAEEKKRQQEAITKAHKLEKKFKNITRSCEKGISYSCVCQQTIGQIKDECSINSDAPFCGELKKNYGSEKTWVDIKQSCSNFTIQNSEKKSLAKCISGDTKSCLIVPTITTKIRLFEPAASAESAILAMQYACYRSSVHCQATKNLELKFGQSFSSEKRKLRIKKIIAVDECKSKPEINSCQAAGKLAKSYGGDESREALFMFKQACDLVKTESRAKHPACISALSLDIEYCSGASSMIFPKIRRQHCSNIFDTVKNQEAIKKASYALIKNCVDRNKAFRENVCARAVKRTKHPIVIVELCNLYKKNQNSKAQGFCPIMEDLVALSDDIEQMHCVASMSNGDSNSKDSKVCEQALDKALKKNLSAKFFYTLSDQILTYTNIGTQHFIYSKVAYSRARYAPTTTERKFWRSIGCEKWPEGDFCNKNDSDTYKYLIDKYSSERKYLIKCLKTSPNETDKQARRRLLNCKYALEETYLLGGLGDFIHSAIPQSKIKNVKADAMNRVAGKKEDSYEKFVWFFRSCRLSLSTSTCNSAAKYAGKALLPTKALARAPALRRDSMMKAYEKSIATAKSLAKQTNNNLQPGFEDYPELRYPKIKNRSKNKRFVHVYENGDSYDGDWKNGQPNGTGIYTFSNGDMYIGSFKSAQIEGKGMFRSFADGSIYEGGYKSSYRQGPGVLTNKNGDKQVANWVKGVIDGQSIVTTTDLRVIELIYKKGKIVSKKLAKMHGIGIAIKLDHESKQHFISGLGNKMPAKVAGVKVGDILISANGNSLNGLSDREVVRHIKGPAGSIVDLKIKRAGKVLTIPIKRGRLDVEELRQSAAQ